MEDEAENDFVREMVSVNFERVTGREVDSVPVAVRKDREIENEPELDLDVVPEGEFAVAENVSEVDLVGTREPVWVPVREPVTVVELESVIDVVPVKVTLRLDEVEPVLVTVALSESVLDSETDMEAVEDRVRLCVPVRVIEVVP